MLFKGLEACLSELTAVPELQEKAFLHSQSGVEQLQQEACISEENREIGGTDSGLKLHS